MSRTTYHFPPFRLQVEDQRLWRGHEAIQLRHKTQQLLIYLLDRAGQFVSNDEIMDGVWKDCNVQSSVLKTTIHELRKLLGDDDQCIIRTVKRVPKTGYLMDVAVRIERESAPPPVPLLTSGEPPPRARLEALPPPLGGFSPDWYVPRPREERDALQRLRAPGTPAVLVGPESIGKSWTLHAIRQRAERELPGAQVIQLNLRTLDTADCASSEAFFHALARQLCTAAQLDPGELEQRWARGASPMQRLGALVEHGLLGPPRSGPLLLVIDHADQADRSARAHDAAAAPRLSSQLLGTLRTWAERSREPDSPFRALRLLLGVSTSLASLISNVHQSPLNLSDPIELGDLDEAQAQVLLQRGGIAVDRAGLAALRAQVGGHPYFLHALCYTAQVEGWTRVDELTRPAALQHALRAHLSRCRDLLRRTPSAGPDPDRNLLSVLRAALLPAPPGAAPAPPAMLNPEDEARLARAGLLGPREGSGHRLRYPVYGTLVTGGDDTGSGGSTGSASDVPGRSPG